MSLDMKLSSPEFLLSKFGNYKDTRSYRNQLINVDSFVYFVTG